MMHIRCPYISVAHMHKTHNQYITIIRDPAHGVWHHHVLYCIPEFFIFWCRDPVTPDPSTFSPWLPSGSPLRLHPQALFKLFQGTSKTLPDIFRVIADTGLSPCRVRLSPTQMHLKRFRQGSDNTKSHEVHAGQASSHARQGLEESAASEQVPPHARRHQNRPRRHQNRFRQEKSR